MTVVLQQLPDISILVCRTGRGSSTSAKTKSSTFSYDAVYEPGSSQEAVFSDVEPVVTSVMDGYNVCIFAYGQTGDCLLCSSKH